MVKTLSTMQPLGASAPDFALPDISGEIISKSDYEGKPLLVIFMCNHCPFVIHIREKLVEAVKSFQAKGLSVIGINSNDAESYPEDSPAKMKEDAVRYDYSFPYLYDESQEVAKSYQAACTPDFFLYDSSHKLVYRGQFCDSRPGSEIPVTGEDLTAAVDALLQNKPVPEPQRPSMGCNIKWKT